MLKQKELELQMAKCNASKIELEFKILKNLEENKRLEEHIELQLKREKELKQEFNDLKE
jgi:hypothetical protein